MLVTPSIGFTNTKLYKVYVNICVCGGGAEWLGVGEYNSQMMEQEKMKTSPNNEQNVNRVLEYLRLYGYTLVVLQFYVLSCLLKHNDKLDKRQL